MENQRHSLAERSGTRNDPAALYAGQVMHARLKPMQHRFSYKVFSLAIDLDRLDEADRMSRLFSVNKGNVVSFFESDHHDGKANALRAYADHLVREAGFCIRPARIVLVCYPRIFGYVFNPLSVYYCYDQEDLPICLIYEVRNTFGERHTYVCPVEPGDLSPAGIRQERTKIFHVSPFLDLGLRYHFRMLPPSDKVRWRILETDREGPILSAVFSGERQKLTTTVLARLLLRIPLLTWKIMAGIHYEALKLWLKGARYHRRPKAPDPVSYKDTGQALPGE